MIHAGPSHGKAPGEYLQSVDLALVLILMLRDAGTLSVSKAAKRLDVSPSTVHRSMSMLVYRGFATRNETRSYLPGPALSASSLRPGLGANLIAATQEYMSRIAQETNETCQLMALSGNKCHILHTTEAGSDQHVGTRRGQIMPAHQNAAGLIMIAEMSAGELRGYYPTMTDSAFQDLRRTLYRSRTRGFAINNGLYEPDVSAVATCLRNNMGDVLGALSVSIPTERFRSAHRSSADVLAKYTRKINRDLEQVPSPGPSR